MLNRPSISECLEHPFLKHAKGASHLENVIIKKMESSNRTPITEHFDQAPRIEGVVN